MGFVSRLIPKNGLVCVAIAKGKGFGHYFFKDTIQAMDFAESQDRVGKVVYLAQSTFLTTESRKKENSVEIKNFFFDIDCGPTKPYADQREGAEALKKFVAETGLPFPSVVSSGNGLYAHWILDEAIPTTLWQHIAMQLKDVAAKLQFEVDFGLTANAACVLRPPGTHNRKKETKPVSLLKEAPDVSLEVFSGVLQEVAKSLGVKPPAAPKVQDVNDEFAVYEQKDSDGTQVAAKCAQVRSLKSSQGNVAEPLWYAAIGLLRHCVDGNQLIHTWSNGHPEYSQEATDAKIQQHIDSGAGPTTCSYFNGVNPSACLGCRYTNKIKSPIVLGFPEREAAAPIQVPRGPVAGEAEKMPEPPEPFMRTKDGLCIMVEDEQYLFYPYDFFPISLQYDEVCGYETATFRHYLPHEGWREFTMRSSLVKDKRAFLTTIWDNHVKTVGEKGSKFMVQFCESYLQKLQRERRMSQVFAQLGWKEEPDGTLGFAIGGTYITKKGIQSTTLGRNVPEAVKAFNQAGDAQDWADLTCVLDDPTLRGHAFSLLAGVFGAPLLRFTGYEGAMVAMVGESGTGKTLMERWIMSAYGEHAKLMMFKNDTKNAMIARLGIYGSLPLILDEVSNIEPMELSELAYQVTQGRDKARLDRNAVERSVQNSWNTLAVASSNHSLVDRLASAKADASAEINRVFEYSLRRSPLLTRTLGTEIFRTVTENYGTIGVQFLRYLVDHQDEHQDKIDALAAKIDAAAQCAPEERFWSAVAAVSIYGGLIAKKLGLIRFEVAPVMTWAIETIRGMRAGKGNLVCDNVSMLGDYLSDAQANTVIVTNTVDKAAQADVHVMSFPRGPLTVRYELDADAIYIAVTPLRRWLSQRSGSVSAMREELKVVGALRASNTRKVLGSGTHIGGTQQGCWKIDLKCPALGHIAVQLVKQTEAVAQPTLHSV